MSPEFKSQVKGRAFCRDFPDKTVHHTDSRKGSDYLRR